MKMRPHPAAHPYQPLVREYHPRGESWLRCAESQLIRTHSTKGLDVPKWKSLDIHPALLRALLDRHPAILSDTVVNDTYKSKRSDLNNGM